jgi:hypothetical protein
MKPFRTSTSARIVSLAVAFALAGGGLIPIFGLTPSVAIPIVLLAAVGASIVGLVIGVNDHPGAIALVAMLGPLALWPYTMVLMLVATRFYAWGWALVAAGAAMAGATAIASFTTREAPSAAAPAASQPRAA